MCVHVYSGLCAYAVVCCSHVCMCICMHERQRSPIHDPSRPPALFYVLETRPLISRGFPSYAELGGHPAQVPSSQQPPVL